MNPDRSSDDVDAVPEEPIDRLAKPLKRFLHVEAASGVVLLACTLVALGLAKSGASEWFLQLWKTRVSFSLGGFAMSHPLGHWINDGLMAIFFFVIGLEVKRELVLGELRELRQAALPIAAAVGGMVVPAGIYLLLQGHGAARSGWGIPMATDIAFVVGCMSVLGSRIPHGLRVLLLSLAIADDIGAILVIAVGYSASIDTTALALGFAGIALVWGMAHVGVRSFGMYTLVGVLVWLAFHASGVHATIAGVILGLMTPARSYINSSAFTRIVERAADVLTGSDWDAAAHRSQKIRHFARAARETLSPLEYLEGLLHPWVGFLIMPVFALANAGVPLRAADLTDPVALAVAASLVIGKPVGIVVVSFLAVQVGLARLPAGVSWGVLTGGGLLAGIGFTMALFIGGLALSGPSLDVAKVGILGASVLSAALGITVLVILLPQPSAVEA
jgi:NhaA family Na+:H+ antiporter